MKISKLIRTYRLVNEIGMRELAPQIGISTSTLCRIEKGEKVDGAVLLKLINWLFGESKP